MVGRHLAQVLPVHQGAVVDRHAGHCERLLGRGQDVGGGGSLPGGRAGLLQRARQRRGGGAGGYVEVGVAAGPGQAVRLTDGVAGDDVHPHREVGDHPSEQVQLLSVLAPEHRDVGAEQVQQQHDHGEHAVEVARPARPLPPVAELARADADRRRAVGVDLAGGRGQHDVDALDGADGQVGLQGPGVGVEVLPRAELQGVDEDGDDDVVGVLTGEADQRDVTLVQGAHGHDHGDPSPQRGAGGDQAGPVPDQQRPRRHDPGRCIRHGTRLRHVFDATQRARRRAHRGGFSSSTSATARAAAGVSRRWWRARARVAAARAR